MPPVVAAALTATAVPPVTEQESLSQATLS